MVCKLVENEDIIAPDNEIMASAANDEVMAPRGRNFEGLRNLDNIEINERGSVGIGTTVMNMARNLVGLGGSSSSDEDYEEEEEQKNDDDEDTDISMNEVATPQRGGTKCSNCSVRHYKKNLNKDLLCPACVRNGRK